MHFHYNIHLPSSCSQTTLERHVLRRDPALFDAYSCVMLALRRLPGATVRLVGHAGLAVEVVAQTPRHQIEEQLERVTQRWQGQVVRQTPTELLAAID